MKNSNSKYFEQALEFSNENFYSADGWESFDDNDDWGMDGGDWEGADDLEGYQENIGAAGGRGPANSMSQPYIIKLQNTTTTTTSNVRILDAADRQGNNFAVSNISITYGLSGISYNQFLATVAAGQTFKVGQIRLIGSHTTAATAEAAVLTTTTVTTKSINGNQIVRPFVPQKDSYQQINTQTDIYYNFLVDALTYIEFDSIAGNVTLTVYLYPAAKANPFATVTGKKGVTNYVNPRLNRLTAASKTGR